MRHAVLAPIVMVALAAAGCGDTVSQPRADDTSSSHPPPADPPVDTDWLVGTGAVLDDGDGPELCLGLMADSLPPQCSGPKVRGWDWAEIKDKESQSGTTWTGDYVVTGTYEDNTFTLTKPPVTAEEYDGPWPAPPQDPDESDRVSTTPCPEPEGGWVPVDPAKTTEASLDEVVRETNRLEGFADLWWDQSINDTDDEMAMNDPEKLVVNVRVTTDLAEAESALRRVWGGALCVTQAKRTQAELSRIQIEVNDLPGVLSSGSERDGIYVMVVYDDGSLQRRVDEKYGVGVVQIHSALLSLRDLLDAQG
ncbi:hypothetical protein BH18ACT9_BH18ACT9_17320 [soil metagenome]